MDKITIINYVDSIKALAHLMIAGLALLNTKSYDLNLQFSDGKTHKITVDISTLLNQLKYFYINEFDHSGIYAFPLEQAAKLIAPDSNDREKSIQLYFNTTLQIPIVRVFELLRSYCTQTDQMNTFKNQEWYNVAKAIRNCFSHDFRINILYENQLKHLPFTWKNISITKDMLGKPLKFSDASIGDLTKLFDTMTNFARELS